MISPQGAWKPVSLQESGSERPSGAGTRAVSSHVPGLDGIRALAVIAVLLFHFGVNGFSGGMLGVDMFFALSGFLITSLLLEERQRSGTIRLRNFYKRRARRLLPALFVTLLVVGAYAKWLAESDTLGTIRADALATLGYFANWWYVVAGQGYFVQTGPPSPLLHTWSLAIEEQFYLIWPLMCLFLLRRWSPRAVAFVAGVGAVASVVLTVALLEAGFSTTRLYYGTDTRAQAILVGVLLAALGSRTRVARRPGAHARESTERRRRWAVLVFGWAAAVWCVWEVHSVGANDPLLYRGGFFLMALATAGLILVSIEQPGSVLGRALAWPPLCYVGRISYGLYLYHWPLFLIIAPNHTGLLGWHLLTARLAATFAAAVVSYHLLERPVRERRFLKGWHAGGGVLVGASASVAVVLVATVAPAVPPIPEAARATMSVPSPQASAAFRKAEGLAPGQEVNVLLLGDSLALTLGLGLSVHSESWGAWINNQAVLGCDLDPNSTVNLQQPGPTQAAQGCVDWQSKWASYVRESDPDVVAIELGRWEVSDRLVDGRWTRIGEPLWDDLYSRLLEQAVGIVDRGGAKVVLFTLPYVQQTTDAPDGQPWEINQPVRTDEYNALVRRVAAKFPGVVSVIDLNKLLDPSGHYTSYIDGVRVRNPDDEHPSIAGGELLRPVILPQLVTLGLPHERQRTVVAASLPPGTAQAGS